MTGASVTAVRRVVTITRQHNRRRRMTLGPHPQQWGCDSRCFPPGSEDAIGIALEAGFLAFTHTGTLIAIRRPPA